MSAPHVPPTNPIPSQWERFEGDVRYVLGALLPERFLASVCAFPCDALFKEQNGTDWRTLSYEVDFLVHLRDGLRELLLLIECKAQDVLNAKGLPPRAEDDWLVRYSGGPREASRSKSVKEQLRRQAQTLMLNVEPLEGRGRLQCWGVVMGRNLPATTRVLEDDRGLMRYTLVPFGAAAEWLRDLSTRYEVLRVQQSPILRRLRQGQPIPELGHPEVPNAVAYARRVRGFLDSELFRHFSPGQRQWAINGSAGMGKSVLLGYALTAAVTDRVIAYLGDGTPHLQLFNEIAGRIGMPPLEKRRVILAAHSTKQQQMLETVYRRFEARYHEIDRFNEYRRIKPTIKVWSEIDDEELAAANVLLVDEAHDLSPAAQARLKAWFDSSNDHYLVVACDRHQKLRHTSKDSRILEGFDFSRCTTRLVRNYRNPFPVYSAAIGLMFRWFAAAGPKVIPNQQTLEIGLGFQFNSSASGELRLAAREDAHPGNNWSHLVGSFSSPHEAMEQLRDFALSKDDLLWVRFRDEDPTFSYETLNQYTYHTLFGPDAPALTDKYIKGQEFPVVVIEGIPGEAAWSDIEPGQSPELEERQLRRMWEARRMVYLAASRATLFLIFILPPHEKPEFRSEVTALINQLARPAGEVRQTPSGKLWSLTVKPGNDVWDLSRYLRLLGSEHSSTHPPEETTVGDAERRPVDAKPIESQSEQSSAPGSSHGHSESGERPKEPSARDQLEEIQVPPTSDANQSPPTASDSVDHATKRAIVTHLARQAAPNQPDLIPQNDAEFRVLECALRNTGYTEGDWRSSRPNFRAALLASHTLRVWPRLAEQSTATDKDTPPLRILKSFLAGRPILRSELESMVRPAGGNAIPREVAPKPRPTPSSPAHPSAANDTHADQISDDPLLQLLRIIAPAGVSLEPNSPQEEHLIVKVLLGLPTPRVLRRACTDTYLAAVNTVSGEIARLRTAAGRAPSSTDGADVHLFRKWRKAFRQSNSAATPPSQPITKTYSIPILPKRPAPIPRQCTVERPITPYRLANQADLPRHRVLDALINAGYRTFSEHMELSDEIAHEVAAMLGRRLTIAGGNDAASKQKITVIPTR
jgi:hypothetical protein